MEKENNKKQKEVPVQSFVSKKTVMLKKDAKLRKEVLNAAQKYAEELKSLDNKEAKIHVNEVTSQVAKFYEKVRKVIDWKDDNALRRGAIERILKRKLFPKLVSGSFKKEDSLQLAQTITQELIRGGHLPNHEIPKSRIDDVSKVLTKYLIMLQRVITSSEIKSVKKGNNATTFIMELATCEIEEILARPVKEYEIINAMTTIMNDRIKIIPQGKLTDDVKLDLIKVSVQRTLYHLDNDYIIYTYLRRKYPDWDNFSDEQYVWFADNILSIKELSEKYINSKIARRFDGVTEQYSTVFMLFDDALESLKNNPDNMVDTVKSGDHLLPLIKECYLKRVSTLKTRLKNSAIFSTLSVILTNFVTFFLIEVPVAKLFYEGFNTVATVVDFLLPALVMFLLIAFIKPPPDDNLDKVFSACADLLFEDTEYEPIELKVSESGSKLSKVLLNISYMLLTILLFTSIGYLFYIAQLPITSVVYDTFTIALTFYAALGVRKKSKELYIGESTTFRDLIFDAFTVPVARVGEYLSSKWREYNVAATFTNYLVEIPFAALLDFIDLWSNFLKERRSEIS